MIVDDSVSDSYLEDLLESGSATQAPILLAVTFIDRFFNSYTRPALLSCDDNEVYVVKGLQTHEDISRTLVTDHIIARLGVALGASVGQPRLVNVTEELLEISDAYLEGFHSGIAHATLFIPNCIDRDRIDYVDVLGNKARFNLFALLYGWCVPFDRQFLYLTSEPNLVYSVDHGHFFPGSTNWNIDSLRGAAEADFDDYIARGTSLRTSDHRQALQKLEELTDEVLAQAVAIAPDMWGISRQERVELLRFLIIRRRQLLRLYPSVS